MMKDYYRILQVHPEAESEVIAAAYKRLMRKYHPDVLPSELRNDPKTLQKAKDINEAYSNLSNPGKRAEYDRQVKQQKRVKKSSTDSRTHQVGDYEERAFLYVRCGQTQEIFKALLIRNSQAAGVYKVVGLIPVPMLPAPKKDSIFKKAKTFFSGHHPHAITKIKSLAELDAVTDDGIHKRLNEPDFHMGKIDWGWHQCPACNGMIQNENGTYATWIGCSSCGRIRCVGGVEETRKGRFSTCPWCGKRNKVTRSVKPGSKDHLHLQGLKKDDEKFEQTSDLLEDAHSPDLLEKGKST